MHDSPWQPGLLDPNAAAASLSPTSPTSDLRRRSFPAHIIQAQQKEATSTVNAIPLKGSDNDYPPPYDGVADANPLSFIQRHFYRSPKPGSNDDQDFQARRFSMLARGSLICIGLISFMILTVIITAVLATVYRKQQNIRHAPIKEAIVSNFPDPAIVQHDGLWYAFATNNAAGVLNQPQNISTPQIGVSNVQIATSEDFLTWTVLDYYHDPLPVLGAWVNQTYTDTTPKIPRANVWAPEILKRFDDGKFVMYYSASAANVTKAHCVGAAISDNGPAGPYTPLDEPIACPTDIGGAIDPAPFIDVDGSIYLAWKVDGNNAAHGGVCGNTVPPLANTPIMLQKMHPNGTTASGAAITILDRTDIDGPLVEAPNIIRSDEGIYFLFFSSGCTRAPTYDLKYAWAHNVTGPYTRASKPLLQTGDWELLAPGSVGIHRNENGAFNMAFHARVITEFGRVRAMFTSHLVLKDTVAKLSKN